MNDELKLKNAQKVYDTLCEMLDDKQFTYDRHDDDLVITLVMHGEDIPMQIMFNVDAKREVIRLLSPIPAVFEEDKRLDGAIATSQINYRLADGSFDFDYKKGKVIFRLTSSFMDSLISKDLLEYMIGVACYTIDDYNDKLVMLANGELPVEAFFEKK